MEINEKELVSKRDEWFAKMQQVFDGTYDVSKLFVLDGVLSIGKSDPYVDVEKWVEECVEDIKNNKANALLNDEKFVPVCLEYGIYGVHYIDKMFGANVYFRDGQWNARYINTPVGSLKEPDLEKDETFQLSLRAARHFVKVAPEYFLFGLPTIASPLNIAVNLYGPDILVEMMEDQDAARHDLEVITNVLCKIHQAFRDIIPEKQLQPVISWSRTQPPGYGQICGCTTQLVSGDLYSEVIADLDERVLNVYPHGGMIHLCGGHTQHIKAFKNMKALRAIQLNDRAAGDLKFYFDGLRDDQVIYLNPCKEMSVEQALEITKGKRLIIAGSFDLDLRI